MSMSHTDLVFSGVNFLLHLDPCSESPLGHCISLPRVSRSGVAIRARTPSWTAPTETPSFGINGTSYKAKVQDTIVLPCEVKNRGNYVLVWKRGKSGVVLTAGATKVYPDERIHLVDGYNLEIRDIKTADAGDYVCQVVTIQPMEITHTLEILGWSRVRILVVATISHGTDEWIYRNRFYSALVPENLKAGAWMSLSF
ncbi:unnamed protein product [Bemisia tabaci]|uniref:Ig-like domain-containing protein n=1 Tax=Bemisia tabaci TaxID=7038 RepID=A0A9P0G3U4_BEMTA|nr:unnamed protein product [Bemisia tabaci]